MFPSRVLVTGAGGFIGSHLAADQSHRGREVVALDLDLGRVAHLERAGRFDIVAGDFMDPAVIRHALAGVDTVFHLAAIHLGSRASEAEHRWVNAEGVEKLVRTAEAAGVRRFVHCSSVGVHGRVEDPPADEDSPCRPEGAYETTKLAGEEIVRAAIRERGFPAVILRPAWVYGPGCPRTERLFRAVRKRRFPLAGRGDALRHCVYIRDMLDAFDRAAETRDAVGEVIIVGDESPVTVRTLIDEIAELVGSPPPRSIPLPVLRLAAGVCELAFRPLGKEPPVSRRSIKFYTNNTAFDISKARRLLGWNPRYDLRAGLAETWAYLSGSDPWQVPLPRAATV
ncbi:MAG TPA: NAD-dependent epimerase/dehydratase family protein [Gemmatimonadota bacterium]|nr:NAD-dependent epimerase/dehydratase family protein [Gemmatimonadota bacterium]